MSHMFLVAKPTGTPFLVGQTGLTIEPDMATWSPTIKFSGRAVITYPTKERASVGFTTVAQSFDHFVAALENAKLLLRVDEIVEKIKVSDTGAIKSLQEEANPAPEAKEPQEVEKSGAVAARPARAKKVKA